MNLKPKLLFAAAALALSLVFLSRAQYVSDAPVSAPVFQSISIRTNGIELHWNNGTNAMPEAFQVYRATNGTQEICFTLNPIKLARYQFPDQPEEYFWIDGYNLSTNFTYAYHIVAQLVTTESPPSNALGVRISSLPSLPSMRSIHHLRLIQ